MLKLAEDTAGSQDAGGESLLDQIVRDGARQMLAAALQAEPYVSGLSGAKVTEQVRSMT